MKERRRCCALAVAAVVAVSFTSCGDGDTIPVADWVAQFDQACVDTAAQLSAPSLSDVERDRIADAAFARMRAVPEPEEMADTAADLLDAIEASSDTTQRTDEEIDALDDRVLTAARALGVSDACIGDAP